MLQPLIIRFWGIKITIGKEKLRQVIGDFIGNVIKWDEVGKMLEKWGLPPAQAAEIRDKLRAYLANLVTFA